MRAFELSQVDYVANDNGRFEPQQHSVAAEEGYGVAQELSPGQLLERIAEANQNYRVEADRSGRNNELTVMNADKINKGVLFRPGTSFTGILKNPAWMLESAMLATLFPEVAHVSWGSYNNYPTGHMHREDRRYVRQNGRYTKGTGSDSDPFRAVDSIKETVELLDNLDLLPTYFMADQEAGRLVLPMMTEIGSGVQGVALNGLDGLTPTKSYAKAPFTEDIKSRLERRSKDADGQVGEATPTNIKNLKEQMPDVYHGWRKMAHLAPLPVFMFPLDVRDKLNLMMGYRKHNDLANLPDHAVYMDTLAALQSNETVIDLQLNRKSSQHEDMAGCIEFGRLAMHGLYVGETVPVGQVLPRGVRLHISDEGTWSQNTDNPYETAAIRRLGLPGITARLALLAGGLGLGGIGSDTLAPVAGTRTA